jgi:predicted transcriptional regulator
MADGGLTIELNEALAERVRALAEASGTTAEALVCEAVSDYVDDWSQTLDPLAGYDRTGQFVDAEEAMRDFQEAVAARFTSKA